LASPYYRRNDVKAQQFLEWMDAAGCASAVSVGDRLGLARETARKMVEDAKNGKPVKTKLTVELAMSATAMKLSPWAEYNR
jgi:hypothetical protein